MSYKPDEKDWIAYLYGELDEEAREKFDQYILENADARQELKRLRNLREMLSAVEDKEVIAPPIVMGDHADGFGSRRQRRAWSSPYLKAMVGLAASLILVILVGRATGTQIRISGNELRVSFGAPAAVAPAPSSTLTEDEVRAMIAASLETNNQEIRASLEESQNKLDASIRKHLALSSGQMDRLLREASTASQEQIRQFVDGIRAENMEQVKDYFELTTAEQKKYIENLLVDFAKYLQQQRNDDLRLVQTRMSNLEQNTDLFKQETEQILTSIITTVGVPVHGETRN